MLKAEGLAVADEFDHDTTGGRDVIAHLFARPVHVPMQNGFVYAHMVLQRSGRRTSDVMLQ